MTDSKSASEMMSDDNDSDDDSSKEDDDDEEQTVETESSSDTSGSDSEDDDGTQASPEATAGCSKEDDNSTSEVTSQVCPICLNQFIGQEVGVPENCDHVFCLDCIIEWSKNVNTCPFDRTEFDFILVKISSDGEVLRKLKVKVRKKKPEETYTEDPTACEICNLGDREDRLLLCDACDLAYHCECLTPPLRNVPVEEWFCPSCTVVLNKKPKTQRNHHTGRIIARTIVSETVRSQIHRQRTATAEPNTSTYRPIKVPSVTQRKVTRRRRKTRRKRRSTAKSTKLARTKKTAAAFGKSKFAGKVTVKRRRRKYRRRKYKRSRKVTKRSVFSARPLAAPSTKLRIANRLGLCKPPPGHSMPYQKKLSNSNAISADGLSMCSLFGNHDQLMDFEEDFMEINSSPSCSKNSSSSHASSTIPASSSSSLDVLGSIMAEQHILQKHSRDITIGLDGSLKLKTPSTTNKLSAKKTVKSLTDDIKEEPDSKTLSTTNKLSAKKTVKSLADDIKEEPDLKPQPYTHRKKSLSTSGNNFSNATSSQSRSNNFHKSEAKDKALFHAKDDAVKTEYYVSNDILSVNTVAAEKTRASLVHKNNAFAVGKPLKCTFKEDSSETTTTSCSVEDDKVALSTDKDSSILFKSESFHPNKNFKTKQKNNSFSSSNKISSKIIKSECHKVKKYSSNKSTVDIPSSSLILKGKESIKLEPVPPFKKEVCSNENFDFLQNIEKPNECNLELPPDVKEPHFICPNLAIKTEPSEDPSTIDAEHKTSVSIPDINFPPITIENVSCVIKQEPVSPSDNYLTNLYNAENSDSFFV